MGERLGANGTITVSEGKSLETEVEYVEGLKWDRGFISPYFVTDPKTQKCVFENAAILLLDKKVSSVQQLLPFLESCMKDQKPLLIVAEDVESEALATLVVNKLRGGLKICCVKSPGFGDNRRNTMQDIVIMGGAGESAEVTERVETLGNQMEGTSSDYDREKLQERVGRLAGGVAVIKVGGASEVEVSELKDRIEDALCATRAAA